MADTLNLEAERAAFEEAVKDKGWPLHRFPRDATTKYSAGTVEDHWQGWLMARRSTSSVSEAEMPEAALAAVERRLPAMLEDAKYEWGEACGGPSEHEIYAQKILSAVRDELSRSATKAAAPADAPSEPDWADSRTLPSEMWKNPLIPMSERLQIADSAVRFRNDVIANLRRQLHALSEQSSTAFPGTIEAGGYDRRTDTMRITIKLPYPGLPERMLTIGRAVVIAPADESTTRRASSVPAIPGTGWKLVPTEPTEAMVHAAQDLPPPRMFGPVWRAMLNAAPSHPLEAKAGEDA